MKAERKAKKPPARTGFFATLGARLRGQGTGAPSLRPAGLLALALASTLLLGVTVNPTIANSCKAKGHKKKHRGAHK